MINCLLHRFLGIRELYDSYYFQNWNTDMEKEQDESTDEDEDDDNEEGEENSSEENDSDIESSGKKLILINFYEFSKPVSMRRRSLL